jgi:ketosteroid isomerase-like protein
MIRRTLFSLCLATALFAAGDEDAVKQAEKDWAKGITTNDFALLEKVLASDMTYTHSDGRAETQKEYIDSMRNGKLKYHKLEHEEMKVKLYGNFATLFTRARVESVNNGTQQVKLYLALLHVYAKRNGRWQMIAHQSARLAQP